MTSRTIVACYSVWTEVTWIQSKIIIRLWRVHNLEVFSFSHTDPEYYSLCAVLKLPTKYFISQLKHYDNEPFTYKIYIYILLHTVVGEKTSVLNDM